MDNKISFIIPDSPPNRKRRNEPRKNTKRREKDFSYFAPLRVFSWLKSSYKLIFP